jgi:hypothetical protein
MNLSPQWARLLAQFPAWLLVIPSAASFPGAGDRQGASASQGEQIHWKPVDQAQVKLDDKTPLAWNVYQPDKKDKKNAKKASHLVLLLLGHRYLMLDSEARLVYEVPQKSLAARGEDFESEDPPANEQPVPSSDWILRDVGPAESIRLTLGDYGRALEVSIPHPPDMRPFY